MNKLLKLQLTPMRSFAVPPAVLSLAPHPRCAAGFTLIELLVVVALIAMMSLLAYGAYGSILEQSEEQLARVRLGRLAEAMELYRADMGAYPGQGPLRLTSRDCASGIASNTLKVPEYLSPLLAGAGNSDAAIRDWAASSANLWMLFDRPRICGSADGRPELDPLAALSEWDPVARRGWRGPYLPPEEREWIDTGIALPVPAWGAGSPHPAQNGILLPPFPPEKARGWCRTLRWDWGLKSLGCDEFARPHPRPLSVAGLYPADPDNPAPADPDNPPRLIYWGVDGKCEHFSNGRCDSQACDRRVPLSDITGDDFVACLKGN